MTVSKQLLILFVVCINSYGCADEQQNPTEPNYPIHCRNNSDCGVGYCEDSRCLREIDHNESKCNVFGIPSPNVGCQVPVMDNYGSSHPKECDNDDDCTDSVYGSFCILRLCSAQQLCENKPCADPRFPNCHEHWEVCVK